MSTSEAIDNIGLTRALVRAVRGIKWDEVPEEAREVARHCLLDFFAVAIAGSRETLTDILVREIVDSEHSSEASLIGRNERASRLTAALVNGAAGHALDFDDTHMAMGGIRRRQSFRRYLHLPKRPVRPDAMCWKRSLSASRQNAGSGRSSARNTTSVGFTPPEQSEPSARRRRARIC